MSTIDNSYLKGYLWKDERVFKIGNLCRRNVKLILNLELSRLRKARKWIFGLCG